MRRRSILLGAAIVAALGVATVPVSAQSDDTTPTTTPSTTTASTTTASTTTLPRIHEPGVYAQELPSTQTIDGATTGVTMFVGSGTAVDPAASGPITVGSSAEFSGSVQGASPALQLAVEQFFAVGGTSALIQLVGDESAPALTAAVQGPAAADRTWDLLVVPAMAGLDGEAWTQLGGAMGTVAASADGFAYLDPPSSIAQPSNPDWVAALVAAVAPLRQSPAAGSMAMLSSGLVLDGQTISSAAVFAGLTAGSDRNAGPWGPVGGASQPLGSLEAVAPANNAQAGALVPGGINPLMDLSTVGTIVMGDRTLSPAPGTDDLSRQRTISYLRRSIATGLEPFVFQPDGQATWDAATRSIDQFLTTQWAQGALIGETAAQAYEVTVEPDAEEVELGQMVVDVSVAIEGGEAVLQLTQAVQTGG